MKKTILSYMTVIVSLTGCIGDPFTEDEFVGSVENSGVTLMEKGRTILEYDPSTWQVGFNDAKKEFRVHDDWMRYYYILRCKTMPVEEGQIVDATLEWTTYDDNESRSAAFKVSKIWTDGRILLWNSQYQLGAVVVEVR